MNKEVYTPKNEWWREQKRRHIRDKGKEDDYTYKESEVDK